MSRYVLAAPAVHFYSQCRKYQPCERTGRKSGLFGQKAGDRQFFKGAVDYPAVFFGISGDNGDIAAAVSLHEQRFYLSRSRVAFGIRIREREEPDVSAFVLRDIGRYRLIAELRANGAQLGVAGTPVSVKADESRLYPEPGGITAEAVGAFARRK